MGFRISHLIFDADARPSGDRLFMLDARAGGEYDVLVHARPLDGQGFTEAVKKHRQSEVATLSEAKVLERTSMTIADCDTWLYTYAGRSADGVEARSFMAMIEGGEEMVVVTTLGRASVYLEQRAFFERVLKGVRPAPQAALS